jgi:hypothetical protein
LNPKVHQIIDIIVVDIPKFMVYFSVEIGPKSFKAILHLIGHIFGFLGMENQIKSELIMRNI